MQTCTILLAVDPDSEPITGTVRAATGETTRFVGYAGLVAAIDRRLAAARLAADASAGDPR